MRRTASSPSKRWLGDPELYRRRGARQPRWAVLRVRQAPTACVVVGPPKLAPGGLVPSLGAAGLLLAENGPARITTTTTPAVTAADAKNASMVPRLLPAARLER